MSCLALKNTFQSLIHIEWFVLNLHKNHINWVLVRWIGSCPHLHKPGREYIDGIAAATDDDDDGEEDENDDANMLFTYLHLPQ